MNLTQLEYFRTVCLSGSISKAAQMLYISQPSLSASIKELEKEFGIPLFIRQRKGMLITDAGKELLKQSERLLQEAETLKRIMKDFTNKRKTLKLGIPPMIGSFMLPQIYHDFLQNHNDISLDITEAGKNELLDLLEKNSVDIVIIPHNEPLPTHLFGKKITQLEIVCCAQKNHALSEKNSVKPHDLKDIPIVLFKNSFFQTEEIKKWFKRSRISPKILMQTDQFSTLKNIISNGVAPGFLFRNLIDENPNLCSIAMDEPIFVDVSIIYKKGSHIYSAMEDFIKFILHK